MTKSGTAENPFLSLCGSFRKKAWPLSHLLFPLHIKPTKEIKVRRLYIFDGMSVHILICIAMIGQDKEK